MTEALPVCDAGRTITRPSPYKGLDWETPCPELPTESLPLQTVALLLCTDHYWQLANEPYEHYKQMGWLE